MLGGNLQQRCLTCPAEQHQQRRDQGQECGARSELDKGDCQRIGALDQAFVQGAEKCDQDGRQHANRDAQAHLRRHAANHQRHAGDHRHSQHQFARLKALACKPWLDQSQKHRGRGHARGGDRSIGKLDRAVKRQPMQGHQHANKAVGREQTRR